MPARRAPLFEAVEGRVIRADGEQRIAGEPFEEQIVADLKFEWAQRPVEEVTDQQDAHQLRHGMRGPRARPRGVMKAGTGRFERGEVQGGLQRDQEMIGGVLHEVGIDHGADPIENRVIMPHFEAIRNSESRRGHSREFCNALREGLKTTSEVSTTSEV
jgi:hypothetical protein